ncbi:MAG: hypothetical protein ACPKPY_11370 [Nitrososphaeraceae archaeon]
MSLFLFNVTSNDNTILQSVNAQNTEDTDKKMYIVVFEQNRISNVDNSTQIIPSVIGENLIKIEEEFLEEISLAPSQQLEELVSNIINNGTNGLPCNASVTTQDGENVGIDCVSTDKRVIWHIYPN